MVLWQIRIFYSKSQVENLLPARVKEGFVYDKNHEKQKRVKEITGPNVQTTKSVTLNTQFFKFFVSIYGSFIM